MIPENFYIKDVRNFDAFKTIETYSGPFNASQPYSNPGNLFRSGFKYSISDNQLNFNVKNIDSSLPKIIEKLAKANIPIESIKTSKSSLEDVFLSLTGKNLNQ